MKFTTFIKNNTKFTFVPDSVTPNNLYISGISNIAQLDSNYVIIEDKDNQYNLIFGHIEKGEIEEEAIIRESEEEAGIKITNIQQIGYIIAEKIKETEENSKYPRESAINVYHSFVTSSNNNWNKHETISRELLSYKKAITKLSLRQDNNQLVEILDYVKNLIKKQITKINFVFMQDSLDKNIPVSQVFNFAKDQEDKYCIVRDYDEEHYSLPGGGCDLSESFEECSIRETIEEAQIKTKQTKIIGVYLIQLYNNSNIIHQTQHVRTISKCDTISEFIPRKNGFETIERKFIKKEELIDYIEWLKYDGGSFIINQLENL